ncbi:hypothetical protein ABPG74_015447 [Tetrahymena malaccensis]
MENHDTFYNFLNKNLEQEKNKIFNIKNFIPDLILRYQEEEKNYVFPLELNQSCLSQFSCKSIRNIQYISFQYDCGQINQSIFDLIGEALFLLTNLQQLSLIFTCCYKIGVFQLKNLYEGIMSVNKLEEFTLEFHNTQNNFDNEQFQHLSNVLKRQTHLKKLRLCLGDQDDCKEGYLQLLDSLALLKDLTMFNLINKYYNSNFCRQDAYEVGQRLKQLTQLQSLSIFVDEFTGFDDSAGNYLGQSISNLINLKYLTLKIENNEINDQGINNLFRCLEFMNNLIYLNLEIHSTINAEGAQQLSNYIKNKTKLETLKLLFGKNNKIGDQGAISLGNSLKFLLNLKNFKLYLFKNSFGKAGGLSLANGIEYLNKLEKFKYFNQNDFQEAFVDFYKKLSNLKNLKSIQINECGAYQLNPYQNVGQFLQVPTIASNLQQLSLYLRYNDLIPYLKQGFQQYQKLNCIKIKFHFAFTFTFMNDLIDLIQLIVKIPNLRVIQFGQLKLEPILFKNIVRKIKRLVIIINNSIKA